MIDLTLIFKGMLIGLAKIIPGVSGSLLAVSLGIYEIAIEMISHPFKNFKYNIVFLGNIGIGIVLSISVCSGLICFFLERYFFLTIILFMGFIMGTFPQLFKEANISNKIDWLFIVSVSLLIFTLSSFRGANQFIYTRNLLNNLYVFIFGFIDASSMVIPGISGTAIFLLLGCYQFVLGLFANVHTFFVNSNYICYMLFAFGLFFGIIVVSKIMNFAFNHYKRKTYLCIVGFAISSVMLLGVDLISISCSGFELLFGLGLFFIGYKISRMLNI